MTAQWARRLLYQWPTWVRSPTPQRVPEWETIVSPGHHRVWPPNKQMPHRACQLGSGLPVSAPPVTERLMSLGSATLLPTLSSSSLCHPRHHPRVGAGDPAGRPLKPARGGAWSRSQGYWGAGLKVTPSSAFGARPAMCAELAPGHDTGVSVAAPQLRPATWSLQGSAAGPHPGLGKAEQGGKCGRRRATGITPPHGHGRTCSPPPPEGTDPKKMSFGEK